MDLQVIIVIEFFGFTVLRMQHGILTRRVVKLTCGDQHVTTHHIIDTLEKKNISPLLNLLPLSGCNFLSFLALNLAFDSRLYLWKKSRPFLSGELLTGWSSAAKTKYPR